MPTGIKNHFKHFTFLFQAIGTAFILFSSALQGVFLMTFKNLMGSPLTQSQMEVQTCVIDPHDGHEQLTDYSDYLNFITVYLILFTLLFVIFFKTEMKRSNADEDPEERAKIFSD